MIKINLGFIEIDPAMNQAARNDKPDQICPHCRRNFTFDKNVVQFYTHVNNCKQRMKKRMNPEPITSNKRWVSMFFNILAVCNVFNILAVQIQK